MGVAVPDEVALVGYDDTEFAPYLAVPLASVRQPFTAVGSAAIGLLFDLVEGGKPGERGCCRSSSGGSPPGASGARAVDTGAHRA
ncbi:LacI family transcriptional regulator [Tessaracoccus sp. HDW20]|nr:LacI family transcriptional regulator [Tessaracoccus coleopterorum]